MIPENNKFMQIAINEAQSAELDIPIGAVLVIDDKIIAKAHNKREKENWPSAHAEILVIDEAAKRVDNWRLKNAKLYVTLEPCPMCATLILQTRISEVYFGAYDILYGAFGSKTDLRKIIPSKVKIEGGIMENECKNLLTEFFKNKR